MTPLNNAVDINVDLLLEALAYASGLDPASGEISPQWARRAARALTQSADYCWRVHPWSEVCLSLTSLTEATSTRPDDRVLAPGWELLGVYGEDPVAAWQADEDPEVVPFRTGYGGAIVLPDDVATPYYYVRLAPPEFDTTPWADDVNYFEGRVIYTAPGEVGAEGECWKALAASLDELPPVYTQWGYGSIVSGEFSRAHGLLWEAIDDGSFDDTTLPLTGSAWLSYFDPSHHGWAPQRLPVFLREAVLAGAEAWLAAKEDGQYTASALMEKAADRKLAAMVCGRWGRQAQNRNGRILQIS